MAILDATQRRFVVTILAQLCPPLLVPSLFAGRWKEPVIKSEDVAALDPDQGALLGPDDFKLFRDERNKAKENLQDADFANLAVHVRMLSWHVIEARNRNAPDKAREILAEIRGILILAKGLGEGGGGPNVELTEFVRRIVDPAEPVTECLKS